jgi:hypothetical protein
MGKAGRLTYYARDKILAEIAKMADHAMSV